MKLTIRSGESVENAIRYLTEYLNQYKDEYPLLKSNMNVYIELEGFGHRICPENNGEITLTHEGVFDLAKSKRQEAVQLALDEWKKYISAEIRQHQNLEASIETDEKYLLTAEEKGRKPEAVEARKKTLANKQTTLCESKEKMLLLSTLDDRIKEGNILYSLTKEQKRKNTPYQYTLHPAIVFKDVDGQDWYFEVFIGYYSNTSSRLSMKPVHCERL